MKVALLCTAAIALVSAVAAESVGAQTPPAPVPILWTVRSDNDAFNFWNSPFDRPDEEYTSGVRATLTLSGMAWWERKWFHNTMEPCSEGKTDCAMHAFSFGQEIYSGKLVPGDTTRIPGMRPNAGWLYVQESSRIAHRDWLGETTISIGMVGPPALGSQMVRAFHAIAPDLNRPTNWSTQLPFEPGIIVGYDHTQRLWAVGESGLLSADLEPHAGASIGNILTEARAGLRVRTGFRIGHPWLLAAPDTDVTFALFGDATVHAVARNEFLMGTLFRTSEHVTARPLVTEYQMGITLSVRRLSFTWMADQLSPEYFSRAAGHAWSRLAIEWRFER